MNENLRFSEIWEKHYFVFVKFGYVLLMAAYLLMNSESANRGIALTLAVAALCTCVMAVYETAKRKKRRTRQNRTAQTPDPKRRGIPSFF